MEVNSTTVKTSFDPFLLPLKKNIYQESPEIVKMSIKDVALLRSKWCMSVRGKDVPKPILEWHHCNFPTPVVEKLMNEENSAQPTPLQAPTIQAILSGRDVRGFHGGQKCALLM
jgi:superfamily II DNA/RNA helicase